MPRARDDGRSRPNTTPASPVPVLAPEPDTALLILVAEFHCRDAILDTFTVDAEYEDAALTAADAAWWAVFDQIIALPALTEAGLVAKVSMLRPVLAEVLGSCRHGALVESLAADVARRADGAGRAG